MEEKLPKNQNRARFSLLESPHGKIPEFLVDHLTKKKYWQGKNINRNKKCSNICFPQVNLNI